MASAIYPKAKEQLLQAGINLSSANVKVVLVDGADYTYSTAHEFLSDVPSGGRVATSANLGSKTFTGGVFDAADTSFTAVTGDPSEILIVYVDTGTASTSRLIAYIDTVSGPASLSVTPNGGDINVTWAAGGIFAL
ncbi:hypothetical protein [Pseudonocardia sp.]|uniref:hypothetical protein n=1 Tax=Pseudonocardia sp. TaxID=60912 RepID=UPI003D1287E3